MGTGIVIACPDVSSGQASKQLAGSFEAIFLFKIPLFVSPFNKGGI